MSRADRQQDFCAIAKRELDALFRTANRMLRDRDASQDAVQEALDKGWRGLDRLADDARLKPWLFRILINTCLDHLRSRSRHRHVAFDDISEQLEELHSPLLRPDEALTGREIGEAISQAIGGLPDNQQSVVQLVIIEQFSYEDAAAALDVPIGTIRSRLSRARASLSTTLAGVLDDTGPEPALSGSGHLRVVK